MTIGQRIKQSRINLRLSQAELAEKVGVNRSLISQLESEKGTGTSRVAEFASALKVNALWLQTGKGEPDVNYTPPLEIEKQYSPAIEESIKLMESTDERGQLKMLLALKDALDLHKAFQKSLPLPQTQEAVILEALRKKIIETQKGSSEVWNEESEVPRVKHH